MTHGGRAVLDRIGFLAFVTAAAGLIFLGGVLAAIGDLPPARIVREALVAARSLMDRQGLLQESYSEWLWSPAPELGERLVRHEPSAAFDGYTVYTSGHSAIAVLVDMDGNEVHRWEAPFSTVWPDARHVSGRVPDRLIYIRRVHVYPNGDLLALYETNIDTPFGYGLAKLDRDGKPIWTYDANAHHDFSIGPDGTIYVLTQEIRTNPVEGWEQLRTPVLEEFVAILSPEGKELKRISLLDAIVGTSFLRPKAVIGSNGDIIHSNTVHPVTSSFAQQHEGVAVGDLMVCLRNLNLVAVVSPESGKIVWATTGPWHFPHDPDPLDNGRIMIFDNVFAGGRSGGSRIVEFDPLAGGVSWSYGGNDREPLRSDVRATSQLLPNGNVLISESANGRIIEVTRNRQIVWEYVNPVRGGEHNEYIPIVCGVWRYAANQLPFAATPKVASRSAASEESSILRKVEIQ
jgi:outer membrane protein assembly factor BamB